jgi:protein-arginine kinase activator protein McsA
MESYAYYCPNCRSNRTKFNLISSSSQELFKNAVTGEVEMVSEPVEIASSDPQIQCRVCDFTGNELRFIKQAERNPRTPTPTSSSY